MSKILRPPYQCMQVDSGSNPHADWIDTKHGIKKLLYNYYKNTSFWIPELDETAHAITIFEWCHQIWQVPDDKLFVLVAIKFTEYSISICNYEDERYFRNNINEFSRYNRRNKELYG